MRDVQGVEIATALIAANERAIFDGEPQDLQIVAVTLLGEDPIQREAMVDSELEIPVEVPFLTRPPNQSWPDRANPGQSDSQADILE